jgi:ribosomal protein L11 methylase PrmA
VHARLKRAVEQSPLAGALAVAGLALAGESAQQWLLTKVVPAALEHYEPVTVLDPAVGSGILLLVHASTLPRWMVSMGLVQYYGCDIDPLCVQMARINCKLYGLNGHHLKSALALSPDELAALPQVHASAYAEAQHAQAAGDAEHIEKIARVIRGEQISLFRAT